MVLGMLKIENVTKRYGDFVAVDSLYFEAKPGEIYGLIGPNGAGKSTTIRMIMNILAPDAGTVLLDGRPFAEKDRNRVGYLPEERGLYRKQKLSDVLLYLAALKGCPARVARPRLNDWLERFELSEWKDKRLDSLSKGMSQKVQFIGSVLHDPEVVFLDEPFSGLDPVSADELLGYIREFRERGKLVLFSTHVMEQAERACDRIVMLSHGKKILDGSLKEIKRNAGGDALFVSLDAGGDPVPADFLAGVAGVASVAPDGDGFILSLEPGADRDAILSALAKRGGIRTFTVREPSLHSIFVSVAKGEDR